MTYELIEPLWAEMLAEHPAPQAAWARTEHARRGRLWPVVCPVLERSP